jgi:hypothetical protein
MKKVLLAYLFCFFVLTTFAQVTEESPYQKYGQLIRLQLKTAPFPSEERANGHTYRTQIFPADIHYKDSIVLIFVPKNFKSRGETDFVVHFHGWNNSVDSVLAQFRLIEQFVESEKNAILVIPQMPKNAPDSHGGKLEKDKMFSLFINEIIENLTAKKILKTSKIGKIVLSGHSGGYRVISYILLRGGLEINEVYLFDGLYYELEKFTFWLLQGKGRFINIYTEEVEGGGTNRLSKDFIQDLKAWKIDFVESKEQDCTLGMLESGRIFMIFTPSKHNDVVHINNNFYKYLLTSPYLKD